MFREHHAVSGTVLGTGHGVVKKYILPPPKNPAFMEPAI